MIHQKTPGIPYLMFLLCLMSGFSSVARAQNPSVESAVYTFFEYLNTKDTAALRSSFMPHAHMSSVFDRPGQGTVVHNSSVDEFVSGIGSIGEARIEEQVFNLRILRDGNLAHTWMDYDFFINDAFHHCGTNAIHWIYKNDTWYIESITDTRYKSKCHANKKEAIHQMIDNWHLAAAQADEEVFFGSMTSHAIYLGTDKTERWVKPDFIEWSKKYFDREKAWDFKAKDRHIYFSDDGRTAWWEELLDTWMGTCRGSGVLLYQNGEWLISHYHLSVTIDNEKIDGFIKLIEEE